MSLAGSMRKYVALGMTAVGTSGGSGTGCGSHSVLTGTLRYATAVFTSPHLATNSVSGHLVIESSVLSGFGNGLVTDGTSTGLSAVCLTGCVVVVGSIGNVVSGSYERLGSGAHNSATIVTNYYVLNVAVLSTGGFLASAFFLTPEVVVLTGSGNNGLLNGGSTTNRALLTVGKTGFATSGIGAGNVNVAVVTGSGNYCLLNGGSATNGTLLTSGKTGLGTGRIYSLESLLGVAVSVNLNLGVVVTVVTSFICVPAALGTGCFLTSVLNQIVSGSGNGGLCLGNSVTYGTLLTLGKTGSGTGSSLSLKSHFSVTERGALCLITIFTSFGSGTGCCSPIMAERRAFSSITLCTGLSCCTSCCCPFVSASLFLRLTCHEYEQKDQCENQQRNLFHGSFSPFLFLKFQVNVPKSLPKQL